MSEPHLEEFLAIVHVGHDSALIAWGGFFFQTERQKKSSEWPRRYSLVDDNSLKSEKYGRRQHGSFGRHTDRYGIHVRLRVGRVLSFHEPFGAYYTGNPADGVEWESWIDVPFGNYCRVPHLRPRTRYRYEVEVDGRLWARRTHLFLPGEDNARQGYYEPDRDEHGADMVRRHEFITFPAPHEDSGEFAFGVLGDPGTGVRMQRSVGRALAERIEPERIRLVLTTGDNIYARGGKLGKAIRGILGRAASSGDEDDDWFASYYLPYRDVISRVPVFPSVGNHDSENTEEDDDLSELMDNFFLEERFKEASLWGIGDQTRDAVFYRFNYGKDAEFIIVDTSFTEGYGAKDFKNVVTKLVKGKRQPPMLAENHRDFIAEILKDPRRPTWRMAFGHHTPYTLGPAHKDTPLVQKLAEQLHSGAGVRVWWYGHDHNFQRHQRDGLEYILTGAAGKTNPLTVPPKKPFPAHAIAYANEAHAVVATVAGKKLRVRLVGGEGADVLPRRLADPIPSDVEVPAA
ncbi:MAG TPA: metallophosphoesterase [Longimicrobium sp.]|jgi:hypothetical protein|nr:metallophosphoesterase [Longimicrobium sp.]